MKKFSVFLLLLIFHNVLVAAANPSPKELVEKAISAMGGKQKLSSILSVYIEGIGHTNFLEQSERPQGPWFVNYEQANEFRDYSKKRYYLKKETKNIQQPEWAGNTLISSEGTLAIKTEGGQFVPASKSLNSQVTEATDFALEKLLLAADTIAGVRVLKDTVIQQVPHHGISFNYRNMEVTLFLNAHTGLPTLVRTYRSFPADIMWSVWGNVKEDLFYSAWTLTPEGILYPFQSNVFRNDQPFHEFAITKLNFNEPGKPEDFNIPEEIQQAYQKQAAHTIADLPLGRPDLKPLVLEPGIEFIPGYWNTTIIKLKKEVVILEAPISGAYSKKVLQEAARLYPDTPITSVITTSDAWPHIGGVVEYLSHPIKVYSLKINMPILSRLVAANTASKDSLPGKFTEVTSPVTIGTADNQMVLYPVNGESGERMMMVYFPKYKLLYGSDLIQRNRDGSFFQKAYLAEIISAVKRYHLEVDTIFAMHGSPAKFSEIEEAVL